jgi:hypothetical protein
MTPKEAQDLYNGKTFYVKQPDGSLDGPREDIYYVHRKTGDPVKDNYMFLQVIDGVPKQAFTEDEILVVQGKVVSGK